MKRNWQTRILTFAIALGLTTAGSAQVINSIFTKSGPSLSTSQATPPVLTTSVSLCADSLVVQLPVNRYVYGVSIQYEMEAFGQGWKSEQASFLKCKTTGLSESTVTLGVGNTAGIQSYSRSGLTLANGITTSGKLSFVLAAFRTWSPGGTANCDTLIQKVRKGTWVITVQHGPIPTCFPPSNLSSAWILSDRARITWTTGGSVSHQLKVGPAGFVPTTSGAIVQVPTGNSRILTGLTVSTSYDVFVRDSCSAGNVSQWAGPYSFTTLCAPLAGLQTENFSTWTPGTGGNFNPGGAVTTPCWTTTPIHTGVNGGPFAWSVRTGANPQFNTGPNADATPGTALDRYLSVESALGAYQDVATIESPLFNVGSFTIPTVRFYTHMFGAQMGSLHLDVWSPATGWVSNVWTKSGQQQTSKAAAWDSAVVLLNTFTSDTLRFRFRAIRTFGINPATFNGGDLALDDFKIRSAPACPDPTAFTATSVSFTQVSLSFNAVSSSNFRLAYGPPSASMAALTKANTTSSSPTIKTLTPGTKYKVYLKSKCSATDSSQWVGPLYFTTLCSPVSAPLTENFDGAGWISGTGAYSAGDSLGTCWQRSPGRGVSGVSPYYWAVRTGLTSTQNPPFTTGPSTDKSGTGRYLYTESSSGIQGQYAYVQTKPINIASLTNPSLEFSYFAHGVGIGSLAVELWNPQTGWGTAIPIFSGQKQTQQTAAWKDTAISLTAFNMDTVVIRFRGTRGNSNYGDIAIDEIRVVNYCAKPTAFVMQKATPTTIRLGWTNPGATRWNVSYSVGATGAAGAGTRVNVTTIPWTLTGLLPGTTYTFWVRDSCGVGNTSTWVGPLVVKTPCLPLIPTLSSPYTEPFTSTTNWSAGMAAQGPGNISSCWTRQHTTGYFWKTGPGLPKTPGTGPDMDHTTGTAVGQFLYSEGTTSTGTVTYVESPPISLTQLTTPELSFWYHMYGGLIQSLQLQVSNGGAFTTLWTKSGQQHTSGTAPWKQHNIVLTAPYAGDTVVFRWVATRNAGFANTVDISLDDIMVQQAPTCAAPTALTSTAQTTTSVTLAWTSTGTSFEIQYGPVGFVPPAGTQVTAGTNPYTVTGLTISTVYDFYVRRVCSSTNKSSWTGPFQVGTACGVVLTPHTQNFDTGFLEGTGTQNAGSTIGVCWTRTPTAGYHWGGGSGSTTNGPLTGPPADHTTGTGNYVYTEASSPGTTAQLESPLYLLAGLTNPELTFWKHQWGANMGTFSVDIYHNGVWATNVYTQSGNQANAWQKVTISMANYANDTIRLRFKATKTFGGGPGGGQWADLAIDDLAFASAPLCPQPTALVTTAQTTTSVTLGWTATGTSFEVIYGPVGFVPPAGTQVTAGTNPFTVTGLAPSTLYDFYVRKVCSVTDKSFWTGPLSVSTLCVPVSAPYTQNFDGTGFTQGVGAGTPGWWNQNSTVAECWSIVPGSTGTTPIYHWGTGTGATPTANTGPTSDHTSGTGKYLYAEPGFNATGATADAYSPEITTTGLTQPQVRFWYSMDGQAIKSLRLDVRTSINGPWIYLDSISGSTGSAWLEKIISLSSYVNQNVQFRFRARRLMAPVNQNTLADIAIDDFKVQQAPACPAPNNVTATPLSITSVQIAWTSGGATSWQIEYGPVGFTPGSGTVVAASTNPFVLNGLTLGTTYQVYVRDNCGTTLGLSAPVGPVNVSTFNCLNGCLYELTLTDSFGDGWAANQTNTLAHRIELTIGSNTTNYTLTSGNLAVFSVPVCTNDTIRLRFVNNGQWSGESGWVLKDGSGVVITSHVGTNTAPAIATGYKYEGKALCSIPCPSPTATFTFAATNLTVTFNSTASSGTSLTYDWVFAPGVTWNGPSPTHTYTAPGAYSVQLIVTDACGQTDTLQQSLTVCSPMSSTFTTNINQLTVDFSSTSTGAVAWYWDFGDNTMGSGTPSSHTYSAGGTYTVSLIAVNACGDSAVSTQSVLVCAKPTAAFTFFIVSSTGSGMIVQFDATMSVGASTYLWMWGDGSTSSGANFIQHIYSVPSLSYNVTLIITNACGLKDTIQHRLNEVGLEEPHSLLGYTLLPNPIIGDQFTVLSPNEGEEVQATVVDALGRLFYQQNMQFDSSAKATISAEEWPAGIYTLILRTKNGTAALRCVRQR